MPGMPSTAVITIVSAEARSSSSRPFRVLSSPARPAKHEIAAGNCRGTPAAAGPAWPAAGTSGWPGWLIQASSVVSFTETRTCWYAPGSLAGECRMTSSKSLFDSAALSWARFRAPRKVGRAMATRMPMIRTTTISSMRVKPRSSSRIFRAIFSIKCVVTPFS